MISKTLLFKLKNHDIYLIDNVSFSYYIAIPSNSVDTTITIEFIIDDVSDFMRVKDNFLISNFEKLDHIPNSLVIPVVKDTTNIENLLSKSAVNIEVESTPTQEGLINAIIKANKNLDESMKNNNWEMMGKDIRKTARIN